MNNVQTQVRNKTITLCCTDCAIKHTAKPIYNGITAFYEKECQICNKVKPVASAEKLFGYYKMI